LSHGNKTSKTYGIVIQEPYPVGLHFIQEPYPVGLQK